MWWVMWTAARMQWRSSGGLSSAVTTVAMPAAFLIIASRAVVDPSPEITARIVVAVAIMSLWTSTVWGAGWVLRRELQDGTLGASVTGVPPPGLVLVGKTLGGTMRAAAVTVPTTVALTLLLGLPVTVREPMWVAVGLLVAVCSGTALGMLLACLFLLSTHGPQLSSALMYPMFLLGGLLIPADVLPDGLRAVASTISLRWVTEFLTLAWVGQVQTFPLLMAAGLTLLYFILGHVAFASVVTQARRKGRFDL